LHRKHLLQSLATYRERFPTEAAVVTRFIEFVEGHPECFERTLQVGHVTGSAWVVNAENSQALFTHHRKLNRWLQLGGHADGESDVPNVALREAREESGLTQLQLFDEAIFDIDIHLIPARKEEPAHYHYDVRYLIQATAGQEEIQVSAESNDLAWFTLAEISERIDEESIQRMARKWRSHLNDYNA